MKANTPISHLLFASVVFVALLGLFLTSPNQNSPKNQETSEIGSQKSALVPQSNISTNFLEKGGNTIVITNQAVGEYTVSVEKVVLSQEGYIVIFNDNDGVPGDIIGESELIDGEQGQVQVTLSRVLGEDEVYYAMLFHDDGDGLFREIKDTQVITTDEMVVLMSFATENRNSETDESYE